MYLLLREYLKEKKGPLLGIFIVVAIASAVLFGVVTGVLIVFFEAAPEFAMLLAGGVVVLMIVALCIMACLAVQVELQMLGRTLATEEGQATPDT